MVQLKVINFQIMQVSMVHPFLAQMFEMVSQIELSSLVLLSVASY